MTVTVMLAEGFEEIEALTPVDVLRRGGVTVRTCSITEERLVTGAHGIGVMADTVLSELEGEEDLLLLPGGMPGTLHLKQCLPLRERILAQNARGGFLAAICAAPTVLGELGLLREKEAVCYPGMEEGLFCARVSKEDVVTDGHITTSRGAGTAFAFALRLLSVLKGEEESAKELARTMCYERTKP